MKFMLLFLRNQRRFQREFGKEIFVPKPEDKIHKTVNKEDDMGLGAGWDCSIAPG